MVASLKLWIRIVDVGLVQLRHDLDSVVYAERLCKTIQQHSLRNSMVTVKFVVLGLVEHPRE